MKRPIAVFDSGIGGLTVLSEIRLHLPNEDLIYFGDTARVPYGSKSSMLISRYAIELGRYVLRFNPKMLIVACNSMSSIAIPVLEGAFRLPVIGVIYPGAYAAVHATKNKSIGVIATHATINSKAYHHAIKARDPEAEVFGRPCPLLVPAIEEGRDSNDPLVLRILEEYLEPLKHNHIDTLILGCTHYPVIKRAIAQVMGPEVSLVDSAKETAHRTRDMLKEKGLLNKQRPAGYIRVYVSDNPEQVQRSGSLFLGCDMPSVELVSPEQFYE